MKMKALTFLALVLSVAAASPTYGAGSLKGLNVIITTADDDVKDGAKKGEVTKLLVLKKKA